ncbi:MAG: hypothetical protein ABIJ72_02465 [bacterium]
MKITYRRKGKVEGAYIGWDGVPETIRGTGEYEGVDLTGYTVISTSSRRADQAHRDIPRAIIVFVDVQNLNGGGVILPDGFNPRAVKFFKTADQIKEEAEKETKTAFQAFAEEIERTIPGVVVRVNDKGTGVEVTPAVEVHSIQWEWAVRPTTLGEAATLVAEKRPFWKEWNERALKAIQECGLPAPLVRSVGLQMDDSSMALRLWAPKSEGEGVSEFRISLREESEGRWGTPVLHESGPRG